MNPEKNQGRHLHFPRDQRRVDVSDLTVVRAERKFNTQLIGRREIRKNLKLTPEPRIIHIDHVDKQDWLPEFEKGATGKAFIEEGSQALLDLQEGDEIK